MSIQRVIDYYDSIASRYDEKYESPAYSHVRETEWEIIEQYIGGAKSVVDVGCGTGYHAILLARRGLRVLGIDISKEMLTRAASKAEELGLKNMQLLQHDIEKKLNTEERFDMALSMFGTLNHVESLENAFHMIQNLLAAKSIFVFSVNNPFSIKQFLGALQEHRFMAMMKGNYRAITEIYLKDEEKKILLHYYTRREVENLLRESNFEPLKVGGIVFFMRPQRTVQKGLLFPLKRAALRCERKLKWNFPMNTFSELLMFVCRKR